MGVGVLVEDVDVDVEVAELDDTFQRITSAHFLQYCRVNYLFRCLLYGARPLHFEMRTQGRRTHHYQSLKHIQLNPSHNKSIRGCHTDSTIGLRIGGFGVRYQCSWLRWGSTEMDD